MKARRRLRSGILVAALVAASAFGGDGWETDWAKAKADAGKNSKDILLDFTGSDWCGWCVRLDKEVFSQEAFKTYATTALVLMEADFPRQKEQSAELKAQNRSMQQEFGVSGFPTVFLTDAQGRPYAQTGYRPGGADAYVTYLKEQAGIRQQRDQGLAKAEGLQGLERAKALAEAMNPLPVALLRFYPDTCAEIQKLDKDNVTGFKAKLVEMELAGLESSVGKLAQAGSAAEALKKVDTFIADNQLSGEMKQKALMAKFRAIPGRTLEELAQAEALADEIVAIDGDSLTGKRCAAIKPRIAQARERLEQKADK